MNVGVSQSRQQIAAGKIDDPRLLVRRDLRRRHDSRNSPIPSQINASGRRCAGIVRIRTPRCIAAMLVDAFLMNTRRFMNECLQLLTLLVLQPPKVHPSPVGDQPDTRVTSG